jgi:hypothetical protein
LGGYPDLYSHGGGGFGFVSDLYWLPQLGLGIAILTNSSTFTSQGDLARSILRDLVTQPGSVYKSRLLAVPPQTDVVEGDSQYGPPPNMPSLVAAVAMPPSADQPARWASYAGTYRIATWGVVSPTLPPNRFLVAAGVPYFDADEEGTVVRLRLAEVEPGLFVAYNGEALDFRGSQPTWRNLDLIAVTNGPLTWQWALLGLVVIVSVAWFAGGVAVFIRRRRRKPAPPESSGSRWRRLMSGIAGLSAVLALATVALVAAIPGVVDSGFLGWLDLPPAERLLLHLPLATTLLAGLMVTLAAVAWSRRWWTPQAGPRYVALTVATLALAGQLVAWHLVGWGF